MACLFKRRGRCEAEGDSLRSPPSASHRWIYRRYVALTRDALHPIKQFAERHHVAVLLVQHLNKSISPAVIDRVSGSRSFGALPRAIWFCGKDPEQPDRSVLAVVKLNLIRSRKGMAFQIQPSLKNPKVPLLAWESEPVEITADELLAKQQKEEPSNRLQEAADWLKKSLAQCPGEWEWAETVKAKAEMDGISRTTLERAKKQAKVRSGRFGAGRGSACYWITSDGAFDGEAAKTHRPPPNRASRSAEDSQA